MNVFYDGNFASGVDMIQTGSYIVETNTAISGTGKLDDGEIIMELSQLHYHLTGAYYMKQSTSGGLQYIFVDFYNAEDELIYHAMLPFSKVTASPGYASTYLCDTTLGYSDYTPFASLTDDYIPVAIYFQFSYSYKSGSSTMIEDVKTGAYNVTGYPYIFPSMSAFTMSRATSGGAVSQQGDYGRYDITSNLAAILASGEPSFIKNDTELTVSFTRSGTDYSHAANSSGTGLLQSGGTALELDPEETFTVTAALTDGINTVTMSALLSANFAIFNANAAKTGIAFGKYATQPGFDCNMEAEFRKAVQIDGALTLGTSPFEILWVNPAPTSSISGDKTMSRAPTEGEMLICAYRSINTANSAYLTQFCWCGVNDMLLHMGLSSNNNNASRILSFTAGSATFNVGTCYYNNNTTRNEYLIPYFIATLKDMKITSAMLSAWVAPT